MLEGKPRESLVLYDTAFEVSYDEISIEKIPHSLPSIYFILLLLQC